MTVDAGPMRFTVRFEQRSSIQDAAGEPNLTWTTFAERRASIERTPGDEVWASAQRGGRTPTVFKLRWLDGVLPSMRLVHRKKIYDILSAVDPDGRLTELLVTAIEHVEESVPA